jgi:hypothetical protein
MVTLVASPGEALAASPLAAAGGFTVATVLGPRAREAMAAEALRCHAEAAEEAVLEAALDEDRSRGNPARNLESAPGGPALRAFYTAPMLPAWLRRLTGLRWERTGDLGTYSYYRRVGSFLGVHRDIDSCDLAVITCVLERGAPADGISGSLSLWPGRTAEPISAVRAHPEPGRVTVRLRPGEAIVLLGGMIPHAIEPLGPGHVRITSPLCFHAV